MMTVVETKKMALVDNNGGKNNLAVGENGYNLCLDVCREADKFEDQSNVLVKELKTVAMSIPMELSKGSSYKLGKQYVRSLRKSFVTVKQLGTILMLCHDLNYVSSEKYLDLNSKLNVFSNKLWKYIKFSERRLKKRNS